jgi:hypothetical protein
MIYLSIYGSTALLDLGRFFSFVIFYTSGRTPLIGISRSQGRYLHTGQHKHRINTHRHQCLKWVSEVCSCLRRRRHCDRRSKMVYRTKIDFTSKVKSSSIIVHVDVCKMCLQRTFQHPQRQKMKILWIQWHCSSHITNLRDNGFGMLTFGFVSTYIRLMWSSIKSDQAVMSGRLFTVFIRTSHWAPSWVS